MTVMADFLVIDQPSAYNAIIGRPLMKKTSMVIVVYCLIVKFPTPTGIRYVISNVISLQLNRQAISEPDKVVTGDVLAIECDESMITLDSLDPRGNTLSLSQLKEQ